MIYTMYVLEAPHDMTLGAREGSAHAVTISETVLGHLDFATSTFDQERCQNDNGRRKMIYTEYYTTIINWFSAWH